MVCAQGVLVDVQLLLDAGADPALEGAAEQEGQRFQLLPLSAASLYGHIEVVRLLLEQNGVDHQQVTTDIGTSAFFCACHGGHLEVAQLLLSLGGADVNQARTNVCGDTPLYVACYNGHTEVVRLLLASDGIDVNKARTEDGATPLYVVCFDGHTEVVRLLLACDGIDVNKARTDGNDTPLYAACWKGRTKIVQLLLTCSGMDAINQAQTTDGSTPLHTAARNNHRDVAQLLVVYGADMTATTLSGRTPKASAAKKEHKELAAWFGAMAGWSQLRVAARCRLHAAVADQLKRGRIDPDMLPWSELASARETSATASTDLPWGDAPDVCQITVKLIKAATQGWAPTAHWLHHTNIRTTVRTVLLVSERLHVQSVAESVPSTRRRGRSATVAAAAVLPILPPEMWVAVLRFLLRRHWSVPPLLPTP
jgi:ankyrin repeat protein